MSLKDGYYYLFYKFYKLAKISPSVFPSDFVAMFIICALEPLALLSIRLYSAMLVSENEELKFYSLQVVVPLTGIFFLKYFFFLKDDMWKKKVKQFDKLASRTNLIGSWIVFAIIIFIIINLVVSCYLLGRKNGIY